MSAQNAVAKQSSPSKPQARGSQFWRAGLLAVAASVAANLLVRAALFAVLGLPADFPPLQAGAIAVFTFIGVSLGTLVFALVHKFSRQPNRTFILLAAAALVLSILPNIGLMANPDGAPFPGGSTLAFGVLIVFHIVAAAVSVSLLTSLTRKYF